MAKIDEEWLRGLNLGSHSAFDFAPGRGQCSVLFHGWSLVVLKTRGDLRRLLAAMGTPYRLPLRWSPAKRPTVRAVREREAED